MHASDSALDLARVAKKLLTQANGSGILKMGAASLNDGHKLVGLLLQGRAQLLQRGK